MNPTNEQSVSSAKYESKTSSETGLKVLLDQWSSKVRLISKMSPIQTTSTKYVHCSQCVDNLVEQNYVHCWHWVRHSFGVYNEFRRRFFSLTLHTLSIANSLFLTLHFILQTLNKTQLIWEKYKTRQLWIQNTKHKNINREKKKKKRKEKKEKNQ